MFKKTERVTAGEFPTILRRANRKHFSQGTVLLSAGERRRVAVVVGKKVAKSAVRRNLLKRRVLAILKSELEATGYRGVVVVLIKPSFNALPRRHAESELRQAFADVFKTA